MHNFVRMRNDLYGEMIFTASTFSDLLTGGSIADAVYAQCPLGLSPGVIRNRALTDFARRCDAELWHPHSLIEDATPATTASGTRRPTLSYDWLRDDERIACKSARLAWDERKRHWKLAFSSVRLPLAAPRIYAFDELLLAAFTPEGVVVFRHDMTAGVSTAGASTSTSGYAITFVGPRGEADWKQSFEVIKPKLAASGELLLSAGFDEPRLAAAIAEHAPSRTAAEYTGLPLAASSGRVRGARLGALARRLDEALHPGASFDEPGDSGGGGGGGGWVRDDRRVACRSAQLLWRRATRNWSFQFRNVQLPLAGVRDAAPFDELLLVCYSPMGVHLYRHDQRSGVSTNGKNTALMGHNVQFGGPRGVDDWRVALESALEKMDAGGELLAFVDWQEVGS